MVDPSNESSHNRPGGEGGGSVTIGGKYFDYYFLKHLDMKFEKIYVGISENAVKVIFSGGSLGVFNFYHF